MISRRRGLPVWCSKRRSWEVRSSFAPWRTIPIFRVESSRWCRARETAELLGIGAVRANKNLDSLFEEVDPIGNPQTAKIRKRIVDHRQTRGLLVMVGHFVNFSAVTGVGLESGEGVLVRANSKGEIKVVGYTPVL